MTGINPFILFALMLCAFMCLYRIARGPSATPIPR